MGLLLSLEVFEPDNWSAALIWVRSNKNASLSEAVVARGHSIKFVVPRIQIAPGPFFFLFNYNGYFYKN